MSVERTLSIIKPDAVGKNVIGEIVTRFEKGGLKVVAMKMVQLDEDSAGGFYAEHKGKGFFCRSDGIHDLRPGDCPGPGR